MQKTERQQYIVNYLKNNQSINITNLSRELNISDDTLRRDIIEMDKLGLLTKVHGGAVAKSGIQPDFTDRMHAGTYQKKALAEKVIPLLKNGDVILIDGGTTNLEIIRQLPPQLHLTIYTNSFPIIAEIMHRPNTETIFLGGTVYPNSQVTVGIPVYRELQNIYADWLILGICSVHPQIGLSCPNREESLVKSLMINHANKVIVTAEEHKLNTAENYIVGNLTNIDFLVVKDSIKENIQTSWPKHNYIVL
ncbi:MAG: DeoR/GlpR family DNA-binding transcription regulator [Marinifilaceae bacterium]